MEDFKWLFIFLIVGTLCATAIEIAREKNKETPECTYLKSDHLITPDTVITVGEPNDTSIFTENE